MVVAKKYVLVKAFEGVPNDENLAYREETLSPLQDGEVLFAAQYISVDPYMRIFPIAVGSDMIGEQVAKVVESKNPSYAIGSLHVANFGWRTHTVVDPSKPNGYELRALPVKHGLSPSLGLGMLGMPGETAHVALFDKAGLKEGETVVLSAAAGAVGSVAGQIARVKNCNVIGFAGTESKVAWLKDLGFTHAFNYKTCDLGESLKKAAPNGADVYIDLVGGEMATTIITNHMADCGRVVIVGGISGYNETKTPSGPYIFDAVLFKRLCIQGLLHLALDAETKQRAFAELQTWAQQGKLKAREHKTQGFENMREAFYGLFKGENIGKAVVKIVDDDGEESDRL